MDWNGAVPRTFQVLKERLKSHLTPAQAAWLRRKAGGAAAQFVRGNLSALAIVHGSDKNRSHYYTQHYQRHFQSRRNSPLRILEIGIGGYDNPLSGGNSLRMWRDFFPRAQIVGIDLHDKSAHDERRIKTLRGSQADAVFLNEVHADWGPFDIIIDDGSHMNEHVIASFEILFPLLKLGGTYVIEDTQTAYWQQFITQPDGPTSMEFLRGLVDGLNFEEYPDDSYRPTYFDRHIVAMHFYHNLVFVEKGLNNEGSNFHGSRFWVTAPGARVEGRGGRNDSEQAGPNGPTPSAFARG